MEYLYDISSISIAQSVRSTDIRILFFLLIYAAFVCHWGRLGRLKDIKRRIMISVGLIISLVTIGMYIIELNELYDNKERMKNGQISYVEGVIEDYDFVSGRGYERFTVSNTRFTFSLGRFSSYSVSKSDNKFLRAGAYAKIWYSSLEDGILRLEIH